MANTATLPDTELAAEFPPSQFSTRDLDPNQVIILPELSQLRDRASESYKDYVLNLAATIFEEGQIEPGVVKETPDGLVLIAGQGRLEAILLIRSEEGQEMLGLEGEEALFTASNFPFRAEVRPDINADVTLRLAALENVQRRDFTPIEIARLVKLVRSRFSFERNEIGDKAVADFLGLGSPANVREHEKLLTLPSEIQISVQTGKMSMTAALEHRNVKPEKLAEVTDRAQELADKEKAGKEAARQEKAEKQEQKRRERAEARFAKHGGQPKAGKPLASPAKDRPEPKARSTSSTSSISSTSSTPSKPATVEQKHVRAAAKELGAAQSLKAPKMAELKQLAETWCGPVYPKVVTSFAEGLVEWASGKLSDKALTGLLSNIADLLEGDEAATDKKITVPAKKAASAKNKTAVKKKAPVKASGKRSHSVKKK